MPWGYQAWKFLCRVAGRLFGCAVAVGSGLRQAGRTGVPRGSSRGGEKGKEALLFLKKKKQKNFVPFCALGWRGRRIRPKVLVALRAESPGAGRVIPRAGSTPVRLDSVLREQSFFASFFQKKEALPFLSASPPRHAPRTTRRSARAWPRTPRRAWGSRRCRRPEAASMPANTGVPTSRRLIWAAPVAMTSGTRPRTKATEVIITARNRVCGAERWRPRVSRRPARGWSLANSTIRMPFLAASAISTTRPICA